MSRYFDWTASLKRFVRFDAARAEDVNDALDELTAGLGDLDGDVDRAIKLPDGSPDQVLALASGQRANMSLGFDASGNVTAFATGGRYRGDWAAATDYLVGDFFRDASTKNIYAASLAHTSAVLADDVTAGKVRLSVNVADVEAAKSAAQAAEAGAIAQVALAAAQAELATTNGAAQVALAAAQAELATTNGSAQVALAAAQASNAALSAADSNTAKLAAQAAQAAAEATVATIPDGTINDATTSTTGVWSSQKVNTLLAAKQGVLISGGNIKTLGGVSLLGGGDIPTGSGLVRSARTSNTMLAMSDKGKLIDITSGTFTQTFDAAATLGDGWWCYFFNSGAGTVTLDPNASEQINGASTYAALGGQYHLVQCDGTTLTAVPINHCGTHVVELRTGNGAGSTNTKIRRFATTVQAVGAAIAYSDSSTLGASFTINQPGIYAIGYSDAGASGDPMNMGLSINSTQLTSSISAIDAANKLAISLSYVGLSGTASGVFRLAPGDVVRAHTGINNGETSTANASFYVRKIGV